MSFRNQRHYVGQIPFVENGTSSIDIPRGFMLRSIDLKLAGTVTVGVANGTAVADDAPQRLIRRIELIADGRDTIKAITGAQLKYHNMFYLKEAPEATVSGFVIGAQTFTGFLTLQLEQPLSIKAIDTLLDTRRHETIQLKITWGTGSDIIDPAATTTFVFSNVTLDVAVYETTEPSDVLFSQHRDYYISRQITATTSDFDISIPVGNIIRSIMLRCHTTTAGILALSDTLVNRVSLIADNAFFPINRMLWYMVQERNNLDYEADGSPQGVALLDFSEDGRISAALQTADIADLKLRLDVTASGATDYVEAVIKEIVPADVHEAAALIR